MSGKIICSSAALDVIGEALRIDVRGFAFTIGHHGATHEDRARTVEAVHRDLLARGLVLGDEFAPELVAALHVFARGSLVIALVGTAGDTQPVAPAAANDRTTVVAVQHGESIEFRLCQPDAVVRRLVGLLPRDAARSWASVTVTDTSAPPHRPPAEDPAVSSPVAE